MSTKSGSQLPGRFLLRVAQFIFEEPALSTIIVPAIADFQREVQDSGETTRRSVRPPCAPRSADASSSEDGIRSSPA